MEVPSAQVEGALFTFELGECSCTTKRMILTVLGCFAMFSAAQTPDPRPLSAEGKKAISAKLEQFTGIVGDWEGTGLGESMTSTGCPPRVAP